jgi:hypothetical protein
VAHRRSGDAEFAGGKAKTAQPGRRLEGGQCT